MKRLNSLKFLSMMCVVTAMAGVAGAQFIGTNDDVPTWRITAPGTADSWNFTRQVNIQVALNLSLSGSAILLTLPLNIADTFTKRLQQILTVNTNASGFVNSRAYQRDRTGGVLSMTGSGSSTNLNTSGVTVRVNRVAFVNFTNENSTILPTSLTIPNGVQTTAFDWVGVGDLNQIREAFGLNAAGGDLDFDMRCGGALCFILGCGAGCCNGLTGLIGLACGANPSTFWMGLMVDHGPVGALPVRVSPAFIDNTAGARATGTGSINPLLVISPSAPAETWTLTCVTGAIPLSTWTVSGSVSGAQATNAVATTPYTSNNGMVAFTINNGTVLWDGAPAPADRITFTVTRDALTPWDTNGSGLELVDFPTISNTENHLWGGARGLVGAFTLDAPGTTLDLNQPLVTDLIAQYNITLNSGAQAAAGTNRALTGSIAGFQDTINYLPANKELSSWQLGQLSLASTFDFRITLQTFVTTNTAFTAVAGASAMTLSLSTNPVMPRPGQPFTISGTTTTAGNITGTVILAGGLGNTGTVAAPVGAWNLGLTAPSTDDDTPMTGPVGARDLGSFGVEFIHAVAAAPGNRIVGTIRLGKPFVGGVLFSSDPATLSVTEGPGVNVAPPIAILDFAGNRMTAMSDVLVDGYQTVNGTATAPSDFTAAGPATLTIRAGQSYAWPLLAIYTTPLAQIPIIDDTCLEPVEIFSARFTVVNAASTGVVDVWTGANGVNGSVQINPDADSVSCAVTASPSASPSPSPTPSPSAAASATASASPSASPTASASPSPSPTASASPSPTASASPSPTASASPSPSAAASATASASPSPSPTASASPSPTASASASPSPSTSPSAAASATASPTASASPSPAASASASPSPAASASASPSPVGPSPTASASPTANAIAPRNWILFE